MTKAWALAPGAATKAATYYLCYVDAEDFPAAVRQLASQTRAQLGRGIYGVVACRVGDRLPWKDVSQGFDDLLKRNPHSAHLWTVYCQLAGKLGGDEAAPTLMKLIAHALQPSNPFRFGPKKLAELRELQNEFDQGG